MIQVPSSTAAPAPPRETGIGLSGPPHRETDPPRDARLANLRQELLNPVHAIVEYNEMLLKDAAELEHEIALDYLRKIDEAARLLLALIRDRLSPALLASDRPTLEERLRHDLRGPLNPLLGYCELLLEDAESLLLDRFVPDLLKIHGLGKESLARLDDILAFVRDPAARTEDGPGMARSDRPAPAVIGKVDRERGRVLVADDNEHNRDLLLRRLTRDGHTVVTARDGREALEIVRQTPFDLILLDVIMPEMNGFEVLEQLKADETLRHLPVLMVSALDEIDSVVHCIERGAEDCLTRPVNPVLLRARIGACLEKKRLRDREAEHQRQIEREKQRSDDLLHVILPRQIVLELKTTDGVRPRRYENVAVLFADIVGFTPYCDRRPPEQVVTQLQRLVEAWEELALRHGIEKIKTIGDAFMAAGGLLNPLPNPVLHCLEFAAEMLGSIRELVSDWNLRVGIHVGPVVAGVVGRRQYLFDLWGDTVNTAARMESHGVVGAITLSGNAWAQVADRCEGQSLGLVPVKGKGDMEVVRFVNFVADPTLKR